MSISAHYFLERTQTMIHVNGLTKSNQGASGLVGVWMGIMKPFFKGKWVNLQLSFQGAFLLTWDGNLTNKIRQSN